MADKGISMTKAPDAPRAESSGARPPTRRPVKRAAFLKSPPTQKAEHRVAQDLRADDPAPTILAFPSHREVYRLEPTERIQLVRSGVPASELGRFASDMDIPKTRVCEWLHISRTTASRKAKDDHLLSQDESERAVSLSRLVGQVEQIVAESGDPEGFDAGKWLARWLDESNAALGGRKPAEYLDTADGRDLVSRLIAQMQTGAYA